MLKLDNMKKLEKIIKAFGNESRLKILKYLKSKKSASVIDIAKTNKLSYKAVSKHLGILYQVDIVDRTQSGYEMRYKISNSLDPRAFAILRLI